MADGEFQIAGSVIFDSTKLKTGTDEGARAIDTLADHADQAADEINQSFDAIDTNVSTTLTGDTGTFGRMADDVDTQGSRVKESGKEIGAEFASNMSETFESGDVVGGLMGTLGGLIPAFGALGVGLGIGGLLVGQMIRGAQQRSAEMTAAIDGLLGGVENDFKESMHKILQDLRQQASKTQVLTDFGGGSLSTGLDKARDFADQLGLSLDQVVQLLQGKMSPAVKSILDEYAKQKIGVDSVGKSVQVAAAAEDARLGPMQKLLDAYNQQHDKMQTAKEDARDMHDLMSKNADRAQATADAMSDGADAAHRFEESTARAAANLSKMLDTGQAMADKANGTWAW